MPTPETPPSDIYPKFFQTIVGVAPDKMKFFTIDDMKTLVECFTCATGVDPLTTKEPLAKVFKDTVGAGYVA